MSDQHVAERGGEWGATFDLAKKIVGEAFEGTAVVANKKAGTVDFDNGAVVVTCAPVLEDKKGRTLARNFNAYGKGAAVFGPNLTNDELIAIKRDFKVATVARTEDELRAWACNLDKSVAENLTESIERVNDALKPARSSLELLEFGTKLTGFLGNALKLEGLREILRTPEGVQTIAIITMIGTPTMKTTATMGSQVMLEMFKVLQYFVRDPKKTVEILRESFEKDLQGVLLGTSYSLDRLPMMQPKHRKERTHESARSQRQGRPH